MRAAATIRKASAYLIRFDAPPPANDLQESGLPVISPKDETSVIDTDDSMAADPSSCDTDKVVEDTVRQPIEPSQLEGISPAIESQIAAAVEHERQSAAQRLWQAREEWTSEIADRLVQSFEQTLEGSIERLREDVAGILKPFVSREIFLQTVARLTDSVRKGLADAVNPAIEISGPADIIDKLSRALIDRDIAIIARESEHIDAIVHLGSTTLATDLEALLAQLSSDRRGES